MATVFDKLNLKGQSAITVLNAPSSFEPEIARLKDITIHRDLNSTPEIEFSLAFVTRKSDVDLLSPQFAKRAKGDAIVWFAYPKGTSKRFKCDFNRDSGWDVLGKHSFETVRAVAIDEDWSALRFRRREFVKARAI